MHPILTCKKMRTGCFGIQLNKNIYTHFYNKRRFICMQTASIFTEYKYTENAYMKLTWENADRV